MMPAANGIFVNGTVPVAAPPQQQEVVQGHDPSLPKLCMPMPSPPTACFKPPAIPSVEDFRNADMETMNGPWRKEWQAIFGTLKQMGREQRAAEYAEALVAIRTKILDLRRGQLICRASAEELLQHATRDALQESIRTLGESVCETAGGDQAVSPAIFGAAAQEADKIIATCVT